MAPEDIHTMLPYLENGLRVVKVTDLLVEDHPRLPGWALSRHLSA